jgi:hypothetical protein
MTGLIDVLKKMNIPIEGWLIEPHEGPTAPFADEDNPVEARAVVREMERRRTNA